MAKKKPQEKASKHVRIYPSTYAILEKESEERGVTIGWILKEKVNR